MKDSLIHFWPTNHYYHNAVITFDTISYTYINSSTEFMRTFLFHCFIDLQCNIINCIYRVSMLHLRF